MNAVAACANSCRQRLKIQPTSTSRMVPGTRQLSLPVASTKLRKPSTITKPATISQLTWAASARAVLCERRGSPEYRTDERERGSWYTDLRSLSLSRAASRGGGHVSGYG